jgi:hypothetical protein
MASSLTIVPIAPERGQQVTFFGDSVVEDDDVRQTRG